MDTFDEKPEHDIEPLQSLDGSDNDQETHQASPGAEAGQPTPAPHESKPGEPPPPPEHPIGVTTQKPETKRREVRLQGKPGRFVFADMAGVVLYIWIPVGLAVFLPWNHFVGEQVIAGDMNLVNLIVALIIAIPPWIVLLNHLRKGRLLDGVVDMFLWAIWECMAVVLVSLFYEGQAREAFWNAGPYWTEMRRWVATGEGAEGDPSVWLFIHAKHLILLLLASLFFGLPALVMGVLQLNYMNFYVANCMHASDNPLLTGFIAWHIWSIARVAGYIILASTIFHTVLGFTFKIHRRKSQFVWGICVGLGLVILDGLLKWQLAEPLRKILVDLTSLGS